MPGPAPIAVTIDELRLRNFRAFANLRLAFSDLTYLVGRNGSGKSTVLDAINLLREAVTDSLENALDRRGGLPKVCRLAATDENRAMGIAVVLTLSFSGGRSTRAVYGFGLWESVDEKARLERKAIATLAEPRWGRNYVVEERLRFSHAGTGGFVRSLKHPFVTPGRPLDVSPPAGNLVLPLVARTDSLWERVLDVHRNLRAYDLSPVRIASTSDIGERSTLVHDGGNAGDVLKVLQDSADHSWIIERLAAITPGIVDVRAEALLGRRVLRFTQEQAGIRRELDASQVSQGTLRALGALLALKQQPTPALVLVDEIENSLHPGALAVLLDGAVASTGSSRVVLTSHSPEVLGHASATGDRIRVVAWKDGVSHVFRLSPATCSAVNPIDTVGWMLSTNALWTNEHPETCEEDLFALDDGTA